MEEPLDLSMVGDISDGGIGSLLKRTDGSRHGESHSGRWY